MSDNPQTTALTPAEQAMMWERMSGERLPDAQRAAVMRGEAFLPPSGDELTGCADDQSELGSAIKAAITLTDDDRLIRHALTIMRLRGALEKIAKRYPCSEPEDMARVAKEALQHGE